VRLSFGALKSSSLVTHGLKITQDCTTIEFGYKKLATKEFIILFTGKHLGERPLNTNVGKFFSKNILLSSWF
jgi:hypothetical protein